MADWYYSSDAGPRHGPLSESQLRALIRAGEVGPAALCWTAAFDGEWKTIANTQLAGDLSAGEPVVVLGSVQPPVPGAPEPPPLSHAAQTPPPVPSVAVPPAVPFGSAAKKPLTSTLGYFALKSVGPKKLLDERWALAFATLPLWGTALEVNLKWVTGTAGGLIFSIIWICFGVGLAYADGKAIRTAGYAKAPNPAWALLTVPYLIVRARVLGRKMNLAWIWVASLLLGTGVNVLATRNPSPEVSSATSVLPACSANDNESDVLKTFNQLNDIRAIGAQGTRLDNVRQISFESARRTCTGMVQTQRGGYPVQYWYTPNTAGQTMIYVQFLGSQSASDLAQVSSDPELMGYIRQFRVSYIQSCKSKFLGLATEDNRQLTSEASSRLDAFCSCASEKTVATITVEQAKRAIIEAVTSTDLANTPTLKEIKTQSSGAAEECLSKLKR